MNAAQRLEHLEAALLRLREAARGSALLVEGRKDVAALAEMGIGGTHVPLNRGQAVQQRIDALVEQAHAEGWQRIVLLMDWDRTGGRLQRAFQNGLAGRVPVDTDIRRRIARAAHCKCIEDLPAEISALRRQTV